VIGWKFKLKKTPNAFYEFGLIHPGTH